MSKEEKRVKSTDVAASERQGPLTDLRVIELGNAIAAPLAAALLGDMGADVIKVEPLERGDSLRTLGPNVEGSGLWWAVAARNKRCITLNLKSPEGIQLLKQLASGADVIIENYRPGVMDRLGVGWSVLHELNPDLVMLSISGYGQTGPKRFDRGFGKVAAEAFSGATNLTGFSDRPPVHPSYSIGDSACGVMAAYSIMIALHACGNGRGGQHIDLALYDPLFRMIEWQLPVYEHTKTNMTRNGASYPFEINMVTHIFETASGDNVVVGAATPATMANLDRFLRKQDQEYSDQVGRGNGEIQSSQLIAALTRWCAVTSTSEVIEQMEGADLIVGPVLTPADIMANEHYRARDSIIRLEDDTIGSVPMPGVIPRLSGTPGGVRWTGPDLGQHTDEVLSTVLGLSDERIAELRKSGVV